MGRKILLAVFSLNIIISHSFLIMYLIASIWQVSSFTLSWVSGYIYALGILFFIIPSLFFWLVYLLLNVKRLKKDKGVLLSSKLFATTLIFHLAVFVFYRIDSNRIEVAVSNYSEYPITELNIEARNNEQFRVERLEPGSREAFNCYCGRIEYPNDTGVSIAFKVNNKKFEGYMVGPFTPPAAGKMEVRVLNDSTFYKSVEHSSEIYWTKLDDFFTPLLKWEEVVKKEQSRLTTPLR